jgi:hypothetical protein
MRQMMWIRAFRVVAVIGVMGILVGCAEDQPAASATEPITRSPDETEGELPTPEMLETAPGTATATTDATVTPMQESPLSVEGPWLVFSAGDEISSAQHLWATNPDGTGLSQFTEGFVHGFSVREQRNADGEVMIAYVTSEGGYPGTLRLSMLYLPGGRTEVITALMPADAESLNEEQLWENGSAITFPGSPQWSPDGKWLAFIGAMEGESADVYSYEVATGRIRQLTSGEENAFQICGHRTAAGFYIRQRTSGSTPAGRMSLYQECGRQARTQGRC